MASNHLQIEVAHFVVGQEVNLTLVRNELKPLQDLVGGYLERIVLWDGLIMLCNEDGRSLGLPVGFAIQMPNWVNVPIRGNFFICRERGGEFQSIRATDPNHFLTKIQHLKV